MASVTLEIYALGRQRLVYCDRELFLNLRKGWALLGWLLVSPDQRGDRSRLAGTLWPDASEDRARRCLNTTMWRLREVVRSAGVDPDAVFDACGNSVAIRPDAPVISDVGTFDAMTRGLPALSDDEAAHRRLAEAIAIYRGDFLVSHDDDWVMLARENLRARYIKAHEDLLQHYLGASQWIQAIDVGRQLLENDPLLEHVHRTLIQCHGALGERTAARRQFEACARLLRVELDADPMPETVIALNTAISPHSLPRVAERLATATGDRTATDIQKALKHLILAQSILQRICRQPDDNEAEPEA